jgi:hypothetical protein
MVLVPQTGTADGAPPVGTLLVSGFLVGVVMLGALYLTLARDLRLPSAVILYALAFNALVIVVKFVLAPQGVYEVNQSVPFTGFVNVGEPIGAAAAALLVLVLYAGVYWFIYRRFLRRLTGPGRRLRDRVVRSRRAVLVIVAGAVLLAMAGGAVVLLVPLMAVESWMEYLRFVFSSAASLLIALALAAAAALAAMAFRETGERAAIVGDVALFASFFWVGLGFLALYQVLWVVYILVLTSIWPLKVVVPK